jgi:CDGSH-type Zn-finger protein/uncharacterized Fe-S cluster protein YjdI
MAAKEYRSAEITVAFDPGRCIHSEECVHNLPEVFDTKKRPWIQPQNSDAGSVAAVIMRCPTGALTFARPDGAGEPVPEKNKVILDRDGPLFVRGEVELDANGETSHENRVALCRCGESKNKPFCDNGHVGAAFRHDGSLSEDWTQTDAAAGRRLAVSSAENGPLLLRGEFEILDSKGEASYKGSKAALCRCRRSSNKPFCDGTHSRTGWREN